MGAAGCDTCSESGQQIVAADGLDDSDGEYGERYVLCDV